MLEKYIKRGVKNILKPTGFELVRINRIDDRTRVEDITMDKKFMDIYQKCRSYTMTSIVKMYSLYKSVEYIVKNKIPGDFVECGVWRGGSVMVMAYTLQMFGDTSRRLYLYDTYKGMTKANNEIDVRYDGKSAGEVKDSWVYATIDDVRKNVISTGYPKASLCFVEGDVMETIPKIIPNEISLLRLDTDWFESSYHEMKHLFPRLSKRGIFIADDYGYWLGSRKATDKYLEENKVNIFLSRTDETSVTGVLL